MPRILIAGGSLGGLCAGLALHGSGFDVEVCERDPGPMETRGAGIVVQPELTLLLRRHGAPELPVTHCRERRYLLPEGGPGRVERHPQAFTSWEAIYRTLRAAFPDGRYRMGAAVGRFAVDANRTLRVEVAGGHPASADLLVCAEGAQSAMRARLLPELRPDYAGYVAWRGVLDESEAPPDLVRFFDGSFTFSEARSGGHMLVYLIPGEGAATSPGRRRLNWVWYVTVAEDELARLLTDREGRRRHASLPPGAAPDAAVQALAARARRKVHPKLADLVIATPDPFLQTIVDLAVPRTVFGRVCLLGDAAFIVRPHTAGAAAKAAHDAQLLASALADAKGDIDAGLRRFEERQIAYGRDLTRYGMALGARWTAGRAG